MQCPPSPGCSPSHPQETDYIAKVMKCILVYLPQIDVKAQSHPPTDHQREHDMLTGIVLPSPILSASLCSSFAVELSGRVLDRKSITVKLQIAKQFGKFHFV